MPTSTKQKSINISTAITSRQKKTMEFEKFSNITQTSRTMTRVHEMHYKALSMVCRTDLKEPLVKPFFLAGRQRYWPTTWTRSPGLHASTRSSSANTSTDLGNWPAGAFSGISCSSDTRHQQVQH